MTVTALLPPPELDQLRRSLTGYTVDGVRERLGPVGQAALERGDLAGVERAVRGGGDPLAALIRLFLLGADIPEDATRRALHPLPIPAAVAGGLLQVAGGTARAALDIRPYAQAGGPESDWWVVSDFGSEVRGGPLATDHVLGIGNASLLLARSTPRTPVATAADIGTGCGVQALHLSGHAGAVTATDISARALRLAATTAALSGQTWRLRTGSALEPLAGERYDLVVANPPFVLSDGADGYDYRDTGRPGDAFCADLVRSVPGVLTEHGTAQLLANWAIPDTAADWTERVHGWLAGADCDAWVWQREVADPGEYVAMWLRDAGERPGTTSWTQRYDAWCDWFARSGVVAVGMGLITMWPTAGRPDIVLEDVRQPLGRPVGAQVARWIERRRWLAARSDADLLAEALRAGDDVVRDRAAVPGTEGWQIVHDELRQTGGMGWTLEVDESMAALVAGCDGTRSLHALTAVLAAALDRPVGEVVAAALPAVRNLVGRGFLEPEPGQATRWAGDPLR